MNTNNGKSVDSLKRSKMQVSEYPFNSMGVVYAKTSNNEVNLGTGTLIASNIVLTAAHNVKKIQTNEVYTDVVFYHMGDRGRINKVINYFIPPEYE